MERFTLHERRHRSSSTGITDTVAIGGHRHQSKHHDSMLPKLGFAERFLVLVGGAVLVSVGQWCFENIQLQVVGLRVAEHAPTYKNLNSSSSSSSNTYRRHHNETLVTQLLLIENDPNSEQLLSVERIQSLFPKPEDSVAVYNLTTAQRLRHLLFNHPNSSSSSNNKNNNDTIVLCVNGGSSTAGGGRSAGKQFYQHLRQHFSTTTTTTTTTNKTLEIVERGHGNRNSLHSAQMGATWYWPSNVQILIWEFSINDVAVVLEQASNKNNININTKKVTDERNQLILWLNQVARIQPEPPLVILVYLWNSPFTMSTTNNNNNEKNDDNHHKIKSDVYESHQLLAAHYDFVVGHVHLAQYMTNELAWDYDLSDLFFLSDRHHPSPLGHAVLSYLLLDLIQDEQRQPIRGVPSANSNGNSKNNGKNSSSSVKFEWTCGTDTPEKRFFQQHVADQPPVASFTMEVPRHNDTDESVYVPGMFTTGFKDSKVVNFGRANRHRQDRQNAVVLPCCDSSSMTTTTTTTTTRMTNDTTPTVTSTLDLFQNNPPAAAAGAGTVSLRAIQLAILPAGPETYLRVYLDEEDVTAQNLLTTATSQWDCLWNYRGIYPQVAWVFLPSGPRNVSNIRLCSTKPSNCGQSSRQQQQQQQQSNQALMSMVAY